MIRVLIVDDYEALREALSAVVEQATGLQLAGTAANGEEAVKACAKVQPDVVLMDVDMPVMDGIKATSNIHAMQPQVKIIILSFHTDRALKRRALEAGALMYVDKGIAPEELLALIRQAGGDTE